MAMSPSQRTYWTGRGSLSPRSAMSCARSPALCACPSIPNIATSGSPGRIRRTTKMIIETPISVPSAKSARRRRYFFTVTRRGAARPPSGDLSSGATPGPIASRRRCRSTSTGSGRARCCTTRRRSSRRRSGGAAGPSPDVLRLCTSCRRLVVSNSRSICVGDPLELIVAPVRVVLGAVLGVPGVEVVGGVHQRGDDGADAEVEVAGGASSNHCEICTVRRLHSMLTFP